MSAKILIVDDHDIVRQGVRSVISELRPEWEICGEAADGIEAIDAAEALRPDVMILDMAMPHMSGLEAASHISKLNLGCRVVLFSMHESERLSAEARRAGARGYVMKSQAARDLVVAIDLVLAGGTFFGSREGDGGEPGKSAPASRGLFFGIVDGLCGI